MITALSLFFLQPLQGQKLALQTDPVKVVAGEQLNLTFDASRTPLKNAKSIKMDVFYFGSSVDAPENLLPTATLSMKAVGDLWEAVVTVPPKAEFLAVLPYSHDHYDNNHGEGYYYKLHNPQGVLLPGSELGYACYLADWGPEKLFIRNNLSLAADLFDRLFTSKPELRQLFRSQELSSLCHVSEGAHLDRARELVKNFEEIENLQLSEVLTLLRLAMKTQQRQMAERLLTFGSNTFSNSTLALSVSLDRVKAANDVEQALSEADDLLKQFGREDYDAFTRSEAVVMVLKKAVSEERVGELIQLYSHFVDTGDLGVDELVGVVLGFARGQNSREVYDFVLVAIDRAIEAGVGHYKNDKAVEAWRFENLETFYEEMFFLKGRILLERGEAAAANPWFDRYAVLSDWKNTNYFDQSVFILRNFVANDRQAEAQEFCEYIYRNNWQYDKFEAEVKTFYIGKNGSEDGWKQYLKTLKLVSKAGKFEQFKEKLTHRPAPDFELQDLSGKKIRLSSLKGKIVVLDFWATWCGPCVASFPAMQQAVEDYGADRDDVVFLFINTDETGPQHRKQGKVASFIKKRGYTFTVLIDLKNEVSRSFNIQEYPTKIIIDKNGAVRLESSGASFTPEEVVDEINMAISLFE